MIYECLSCGKSFTLKKEARKHAKEHGYRFTEFRISIAGKWIEQKYYVYREKEVKTK